MSQHHATIRWRKTTDGFDYKEYNREHEWEFKHGAVVAASAAPKFRGNPDFVDPEEAFVASLSACHMLTFLAICSRDGRVVERYDDDAVGYLEFNDKRQLVVTHVALKPRVQFADGHTPPEDVLGAIHEQSHDQCFLANSVTCEITVE